MNMSEKEFDLVVIGGGPAGYIGAIRAAQLGMKVACVEKRKTLGGTCLNVGCIPSKALLNMSEKFEEANKHFADIGIETQTKLNLSVMLGKKDKVVSDLVKGIDGLFAKNKITRLQGTAKFISPTQIEVDNEGNKETITGKKYLIATGSDIMPLKGIEIDEKRIVSSTGALSILEVPKKLIVIGGGYIGLELGSVWRRLGAEVTVIEFFDRIVPAMDHEVGNQLHKVLEKQGMKFKLSTKVMSAKAGDKEVELELESADGKSKEKLSADYVLVSVGRKPHTETLNLSAAGVEMDERGRIKVDAHFKTNIANIYAVGDVIPGPMLAHKAEEEAVAAVEMMAGKAGHVNYNTIPGVVYTAPEVAFVGKTEEELKQAGVQYKVGKFPFLANSRARAVNETDGFVKILADTKTDRILGVHIIGCDAGTIIAEMVVAMEFYASSEDIARICHAHPTLNEAVKEAALAVEKRTLNM
ncbi:MAG: lpd3 [Rickettsiaceae bacterium]|jgi:dihydrolipoamide dehydrogenase|nr:lpd3 [Rickettsiaceae bacterium]